MSRQHVMAAIVGSFCYLLVGTALGELIINGDFSQGNAGFGTDYRLSVPTNSNPYAGIVPRKPGLMIWKVLAAQVANDPGEGKYTVASNPSAWNPAFVIPHSAELPVGNTMLIANGSGNAGDLVWYQDISVVAGALYDVSFSAASLYPANAAQLRFYVGLDPVDPLSMIEVAAIDLTGITGENAWQTGTGQFLATKTGSVKVHIANLITAPYGNDFAIDNVSVLHVVPEPSTISLLGWGTLVVALALHRRHRQRR